MQVLENLLCQVIEFAEFGTKILIIRQCHYSHRKMGRLHFTLKFTGKSLSPEKIAAIENEKAGWEEEICREHFGLIVSKQICQIQGGVFSLGDPSGKE